jgi:C4-type Zn-finger protein
MTTNKTNLQTRSPPLLQKTNEILEEVVATCPVCGDVVVEGRRRKEIGHGHSMTLMGIWCRRCGVKFQFAPPNIR